mmetsp:Transcript_19592/g.29763  ORF Transcript_19592/g.29763 Transcript_19592/m.29763 type:complete len:326 (+) Transcript_19592:99-1076(+)
MTSSTTSNESSANRLKFAWYALTAVAVFAIILLNSDTRIVQMEPKLDSGLYDSSGSVGRLIPNLSKPIKMISILGERNSGTRWLYAHVGECFNHTLRVERHLTRYKHWFQYPNASRYPHDTLVLAQFRNPFDWLQAMRKVPHHSPSHIGLKWKEFLTKEWTTPRIGSDLNMTKTQMKNGHCQENFPYREIISCNLEPLPKESYTKIRYSEHQPFYELKSDGTPYKNIMEMRAAKIRNFLAIRDYVGVADIWTIQYEYLLMNGTEHLISKLEEWTGVKRQCEVYPSQNRRKRPFQRDFAEFVNKNVDWSAEGLIGYTQHQFDPEES